MELYCELLGCQFSELAVFAELGLKRSDNAARATAAGGFAELFHVMSARKVEFYSAALWQLKMGDLIKPL